MEKLQYVLVVAESVSGISELTAGAASLGEKTELMYAGDRENALNAETAYYFGNTENNSFISFIPAIISFVKQNKPQLVLTEATKNGRLTAAVIAASMETSALTDSMEISINEGSVISKRMVYGGAAIKTEKSVAEVSVACVGGGMFEAGSPAKAGKIVDIEGHVAGMRFVEKRTKEIKSVNIAAAKRVVGVGRGFGGEENIVLARELAQAIGAEVGCSRPVAEEEKWLPKEVYCGISGVMIKPEIYIACGISGQVQHMSGVNQSKVIVAINKDKSAPIFEKCDYGIVGDLKTILPALTKKLIKN